MPRIPGHGRNVSDRPFALLFRGLPTINSQFSKVNSEATKEMQKSELAETLSKCFLNRISSNHQEGEIVRKSLMRGNRQKAKKED